MSIFYNHGFEEKKIGLLVEDERVNISCTDLLSAPNNAFSSGKVHIASPDDPDVSMFFFWRFGGLMTTLTENWNAVQQ